MRAGLLPKGFGCLGRSWRNYFVLSLLPFAFVNFRGTQTLPPRIRETFKDMVHPLFAFKGSCSHKRSSQGYGRLGLSEVQLEQEEEAVHQRQQLGSQALMAPLVAPAQDEAADTRKPGAPLSSRITPRILGSARHKGQPHMTACLHIYLLKPALRSVKGLVSCLSIKT